MPIAPSAPSRPPTVLKSLASVRILGTVTSPDTTASHGSDRLSGVRELPLSTPIWQVSDYAYDTAEHYEDVINERRPGQVYGRYGNPTLEALAEVLALLEMGEKSWVFTSGMGAIHACLMYFAGADDKVVASRTLYGGTYGLLTEGAPRAGIEVVFADSTDAPTFDRALADGASLAILESVSNPTFEVADVEGIAECCQRRNIPLIVDNTVASPVFMNPLQLGADVVVHSTSKYIGGHHDMMGGAVVGASEAVDGIRHLAIRYGTTASAFESWLALRGIATLGIRMKRHAENASALAQLLAGSDRVENVLYPGLPSHPQHERAVKIMSGFTGMVAADLGTKERAWRFMDSLRVARVGSSFGGVRSEVTHPASTSHRQFSKEDLLLAGISEGLVRISAGIEDRHDLIEDFSAALVAAS